MIVTLVQQLERIAARVATLGLARTAADLRKVAAELRRIESGPAATPRAD
jgi:hypothetical protein